MSGHGIWEKQKDVPTGKLKQPPEVFLKKGVLKIYNRFSEHF